MSNVVRRVDLSVLHVGAGRYMPGDTSHSTFSIWRQLAKGFNRYTVVGRSCRNSFSRIDEGNLTVHLLPSYFSSEAEFLFTQAAVIAIGFDVQCNVVVAQCPVKGGLAGVALSRTLGARLLTELHGYEYFKRPASGISQAAIQWMTRYPLECSHRIRALSEGMKQKTIERYGSDLKSKIVCLPPRVDLRKFSKVKQNWSLHDPPRLIMVGAVNENKGQLRLVSLLLRAKMEVEIWIVGEGPHVRIIRELAYNLGGAEKVKLLGQLSHVDLSHLLPEADVFVMFSHSEGMPRAVIEAMAVGLPIITSNAGFSADLVTNGVHGFVLGNNPMSEILDCIAYLLADHKMRARMGESARTRAVSEFDSETLYSRYRALICETAEA
jgi:glycosyltransferase involved in cell wall biosynthesis